IPLVEPLRLRADAAARGLAALQAVEKHAHRVGLRAAGCRERVHPVAALRRAEMREAGAGEIEVRRIGVIDGRQEAGTRAVAADIEDLGGPTREGGLLQGSAFGERRSRELVERGDTR